jgi:hypothetical protein
MDMQSVVKMVSDIRKQSAGNLTIGKILDKINGFDGKETFALTNNKYLTGEFDSYRGYYEDLALEYHEEDTGFNTIEQLKRLLNNALQAKKMYGYKGGGFSITKDTLVWVANYSHLGEMIIDIQKINDSIIVITKEEEW